MPNMSGQTQQCPRCARPHTKTLISVRLSIRYAPYVEMLFPISIRQDFSNKRVVIEAVAEFQDKMFAVARSITNKCENGQTVCKILNYNPNNLVLKRLIEVARIMEPTGIISCVKYKSMKITHFQLK